MADVFPVVVVVVFLCAGLLLLFFRVGLSVILCSCFVCSFIFLSFVVVVL